MVAQLLVAAIVCPVAYMKLLSPELRHKLLIHRSFSHVIDVVAQSFHRYGKDDFQYFDGYSLARGTLRSACRTRVPEI